MQISVGHCVDAEVVLQVWPAVHEQVCVFDEFVQAQPAVAAPGPDRHGGGAHDPLLHTLPLTQRPAAPQIQSTGIRIVEGLDAPAHVGAASAYASTSQSTNHPFLTLCTLIYCPDRDPWSQKTVAQLTGVFGAVWASTRFCNRSWSHA